MISAEDVTETVRGSEHLRLKESRSETDLGTLFASGVLDRSHVATGIVIRAMREGEELRPYGGGG